MDRYSITSIPEGTEDILTNDALEFIAQLHRGFNHSRLQLLKSRKARQISFEKDITELGFLPRTLEYRTGDVWQIAPIPEDMKTRTVEITGPVDRKMVINALNSGANCFMADFEDSNSPTWENCVYGQLNLRDAVNRTIELKTEAKNYKLKDNIAKLMVRPRGLHLAEKHMQVDGEPVSASIFDFGLYMCHNAKTLLDRGETPAFYLPKLEDYSEAEWWSNVISTAEEVLKLPQGLVRLTVLIETLPAVFQMEEILKVLTPHIAGLNAGRWDYIFSAIKVLGKNPKYIFPNRSEVTMGTHMMHSYARLLAETCHKHGAQAIGGMSAFIPRKDDMLANELAMTKVRKDKTREAFMGYDGTWVAHPGLVQVARDVFKNTENKGKYNDTVTREDLLQVPTGSIAYDELFNNIRISLHYMHNWLNGNGCVAINYLMEDLATMEISRAQVWQWRYHAVELEGGEGKVDDGIVDIILDQIVRDNPEYDKVAVMFADMVKQDECLDFSSVIMYEELR